MEADSTGTETPMLQIGCTMDEVLIQTRKYIYIYIDIKVCSCWFALNTEDPHSELLSDPSMASAPGLKLNNGVEIPTTGKRLSSH